MQLDNERRTQESCAMHTTECERRGWQLEREKQVQK